jgi:transaldolase
MVIYADGAGLAQMRVYAKDPQIAGFTTNPSLMRQAGISDYRHFADAVLGLVGHKPVSFEVLADDMDAMEAQALEIAGWGENVIVKVPIVNSKGEGTGRVIRHLTSNGVRVNVTAVMTVLQAALVLQDILEPSSIISIFAGRIADTGVDPEPIVTACAGLAKGRARILWASAREAFNVVQAERCGAEIITLMPELIAKLNLRGKDLNTYSLETARQFHSDGMGITF